MGGFGSGGSRNGSGRKTKADEDKIRKMAEAAIIEKYGSLQAGFESLLTSGSDLLKKFVWEHAVGKPRDKVDADIAGFLDIVWNEQKLYETKSDNP